MSEFILGSLGECLHNFDKMVKLEKTGVIIKYFFDWTHKAKLIT